MNACLKIGPSLLLLAVAVFLGVIFSSCESSNEKMSIETNEAIQRMEMSCQKRIEDKIELVCLKNGIVSQGLKKDMYQYFQKNSWISKYSDAQEKFAIDKSTTFEDILLSTEDTTDINAIKTMAATHQVPIEKVASAIFDYEVLSACNSD